MTTVWLRHDDAETPDWMAPGDASDYVHHRINDLAHWLESLDKTEDQPAPR